MKYISILGSTGSIGIQSLEVVRMLKDRIKVVGLAARSNVDLMERQVQEFRPNVVALQDEQSAEILRRRIEEDVEVLSGEQGVIQVATAEQADMVLSAVVGISGLIPTIKAIEAGKDVALSNKESLVAAGHIIMKSAQDAGVNIFPVDGEHSAIWQCLEGCKDLSTVRRLILTASGGPFRDKPREELSKVTPEEALKHPNWKMGPKITIDSATLMNKGFEVIEAKWLFNMDTSKIDVLIHLESVIHSMVEFIDGSIIAQLGITDMRLPIQLALTYPERVQSELPRLDLVKIKQLNFREVDTEKFPCLRYAYEAADIGGTMPAVLSSADEIAVEAFLRKKICFTDIPKIIKQVMDIHLRQGLRESPSLSDVLSACNWAVEMSNYVISQISHGRG